MVGSRQLIADYFEQLLSLLPVIVTAPHNKHYTGWLTLIL
jgi:hypothetical protein